MQHVLKIIRESLREAAQSEHYKERLYDRFLNRSDLPVGYEIAGTRGQYKQVGTYTLPESIKQQILENAKLVENYNFPKSKDFGVLIANVMIDKNKIAYFSESHKQEASDKSLLFVDEQTDSNGNMVFAIVRENSLYTVFFAKNYVPQSPEKLRVDVIVKNMKNLRQGKIR